jgi:hypothetical protein
MELRISIRSDRNAEQGATGKGFQPSPALERYPKMEYAYSKF